MAKIISPSHRVQIPEFALVFDLIGHPGSGYSFECDASGTLKDLTDTQRGSYAIASDQSKYRCLGVQDYSRSYREPAVLECDCGKHVTLEDPLENQCDCGRAYNLFGQAVRANYGRRECIEDGWAYDENDY